MSLPLSRRLSFRQAKLSMLVAVVLGFFFTALQLAFDVYNERQAIRAVTDQEVESIREAATLAAYSLDTILGARVLSGLMVFSSIESATIYDNFGDVVATRARPDNARTQDNYVSRLIVGDLAEIEKDLIWPADQRYLGKLHVDLDGDQLAQNLKSRFWFVFGSGLARNLALSLVLLIIFHLILTRPLDKAASALAQNRGPDAFTDMARRKDELGVIFGSLQSYLRDLGRKNEELAASEEKFRRLVEASKDRIVIYSHDPEGMITYVSPSVSDILGYSRDEFSADYQKYLTDNPLNAGAIKSTQASVRGERQPPYDMEFWHKDGTKRTFLISEIPIKDREQRVIAVEGVATDVTEQRAAEETYRGMALTDPLTGLANRNAFMRQIERNLAVSRRQQRPLGLLLIDLDKFKPINDTHGHPAGDEVLREVGQRLKSICRESDSACRLGGDEFAIIVTSLEQEPDVDVPAKRVITELNKPIEFGATRLYIGVSIGVAMCPADATNQRDLMRRADEALYNAKRAGRNTYRRWRRG